MIPWLVPQSNHQAAEVVVEGPLVEHHHHLFHYVVKVLVLYKILLSFLSEMTFMHLNGIAKYSIQVLQNQAFF